MYIQTDTLFSPIPMSLKTLISLRNLNSEFWGFHNSENLGMEAPNSGSGKQCVIEKEKRSGGKLEGEAEHEMHIWTERERRKKMRSMFSGLHALLPHLPPKADKSTIVDEAVKYIETLQHTLQTLEQRRLGILQSAAVIDSEPSVIVTSPDQTIESREAFLANLETKNLLMASRNMLLPSLPYFRTWFSQNVVVNMCGDDAHISLCSARKPGILSTIFYILEKHKLEVVSAHVSSDHYRSMYMIHAHVGETSDEYPDALSVEDIFKVAVGEMNLWLLSC